MDLHCGRSKDRRQKRAGSCQVQPGYGPQLNRRLGRIRSSIILRAVISETIGERHASACRSKNGAHAAPLAGLISGCVKDRRSTSLANYSGLTGVLPQVSPRIQIFSASAEYRGVDLGRLRQSQFMAFRGGQITKAAYLRVSIVSTDTFARWCFIA